MEGSLICEALTSFLNAGDSGHSAFLCLIQELRGPACLALVPRMSLTQRGRRRKRGIMSSPVAGSEAQMTLGRQDLCSPVSGPSGACVGGLRGAWAMGGTRHTACALPELVTQEFNHAAHPLMKQRLYHTTSFKTGLKTSPLTVTNRSTGCPAWDSYPGRPLTLGIQEGGWRALQHGTTVACDSFALCQVCKLSFSNIKKLILSKNRKYVG